MQKKTQKLLNSMKQLIQSEMIHDKFGILNKMRTYTCILIDTHFLVFCVLERLNQLHVTQS